MKPPNDRLGRRRKFIGGLTGPPAEGRLPAPTQETGTQPLPAQTGAHQEDIVAETDLGSALVDLQRDGTRGS